MNELQMSHNDNYMLIIMNCGTSHTLNLFEILGESLVIEIGANDP